MNGRAGGDRGRVAVMGSADVASAQIPASARGADGARGANGAPSAQVRSMFARIAPTYDLLNHLLSMGRDRAWRRLVAANLGPSPQRVLDLCAGTGDLALEIVRRAPQAAVVSGDFCFEMLARGRDKGLHLRTRPAVCDALRLPFAAGTFDAVSVAFGVRNFESVESGLAEIQRVMRPGATLAVLEFFRRESPWRDLPFTFYFRQVLPRVGRIVSRDREAYSYLPRSVGRFVTRVEFENLLQHAGFDDIRRRELDAGIATLYLARRCRDGAHLASGGTR